MADSLFDQEPDYLEELIGPGGKYDVAKYSSRDEAIKAMAKGKALADRTVEHKNAEFDELREEYLKVRSENNAKPKWEDILNRKNPDDKDPASTNAGNVDRPITDPLDVDKIVEAKLMQIEAKRNEKANLDKVDQRLRERYGDNARTILRDKMNTLNISDEDLKFLARKSPEAVFNTLGLNAQQESFEAPARGTLRSDSFSPQSDIRDAVYYEKLRQSDPKKYFDPKTSTQRLKDMDSPDFLKRYRELNRA